MRRENLGILRGPADFVPLLGLRAVSLRAVTIAVVATQAPVPQKKWICCKEGTDMYAPRWDTACPTGGRRMQAMVEPYCPKQLAAPKRILQAVQHPVAPNCTNFNVRRRLQDMVTFKCPVNIEGYQCFKNNTNKKCA